MNLDSNPSLICLTYSTPEEHEKLLLRAKENNIPVREIHLLDFSISLDEKYDSQINFFKHFIQSDYWRPRTPLQILDKLPFMVKGMVLSGITKMGFEPIKTEFNFMNDNKHELLYTLLCPLFIQDKTKYCETETEKKNMEKLKTFSSEGYKPVISGVWGEDGKLIS